MSGNGEAPPAAPVVENSENESTAAGTSNASSSSNPTSTEERTSATEREAPSSLRVYKGYEGNMNSYCEEWHHWLTTAYLQRECAVSAYFTALNLLYNNGSSRGSSRHRTQTHHQRAFNNNNLGEPNRQGRLRLNIRRFFIQGLRANNNNILAFDFNVAPIWKRVLAEFIDFIVLLFIKLFVTLTIIDTFDLIDIDSIDFDALQEASSFYEIAVTLSWEFLILEICHRIVVCVFEAYCISKNGATPGKSFMRLRVLYCERVIPVTPQVFGEPNGLPQQGMPIDLSSNRIMVSPGSFLSFQKSLLRSGIKNLSLALFLPFFFTLFHFEHSRTLYDLAAKSIVVELRY